MPQSRNNPLRFWIFIFVVIQAKVQAGPAHASLRFVREIYPEIEPENDTNQPQVCIVGDVVYGVDEPVPAEQPCLKCRCQPPGVQCETIKCAKKPGCKAIHRPNKCCPDYQCECHHEDRVYANGERLKTPPGGECKVCYCRGGELQCADVSCYIRTDCEGKTVPGTCCPKYDHCPPREPLDINRHVLDLWPLSRVLPTEDNAIKITQPAHAYTDSIRKQIEQPNITIQEIIPEAREIAITTPTKSTDDADPGFNDLVTDPEPDSSEISEVFQHPPPVLRIGDKLLFLKQGELVQENGASTPGSVITIIGAEGLQRGFEESGEHDFKQFSTTNDLELKTEESSHILSLVKRKKQPEGTTTEESQTSTVDGTTKSIEATQEILNSTTIASSTSTSSVAKILPEVLEIRGNSTDFDNSTNPDWLKSTSESTLINLRASLPDEVLEADAPSDFEVETTTSEALTNSTSIESMEEEVSTDSVEATTVHVNTSSALVSEENASVEGASSTPEVDDLVKEAESTTVSKLQEDDNVEVLNETLIETAKRVETATKPMKKEVEVLDLNSTKWRKIEKRESSDDVFQELNAELGAEADGERYQSEEEEKGESERIFKELLEETSTPKSTRKLAKDEETLQRVSDAIAKLTLKGKQKTFDTGVLSVISEFFGAQYRQ